MQSDQSFEIANIAREEFDLTAKEIVHILTRNEMEAVGYSCELKWDGEDVIFIDKLFGKNLFRGEDVIVAPIQDDERCVTINADENNDHEEEDGMMREQKGVNVDLIAEEEMGEVVKEMIQCVEKYVDEQQVEKPAQQQQQKREEEEEEVVEENENDVLGNETTNSMSLGAVSSEEDEELSKGENESIVKDMSRDVSLKESSENSSSHSITPATSNQFHFTDKKLALEALDAEILWVEGALKERIEILKRLRQSKKE